MRSSKLIGLTVVFLGATAAAGFWLSLGQEPSQQRSVEKQTLSDRVNEKGQERRSDLAKAQKVKPPSIEQSIPGDRNSSAETEIVKGIEVLKNRNCTVKEHYLDNGDGTTKKLYSCEPNEKPPQDIYETYSNQELEVLAYHDHHAAFILSRRVLQNDYKKGMELAFRSTALSGDPKPIFSAMTYFPIPMKLNNVVQVEGVTNQYVMSGVLKELGLDDSTYNNRRLSVMELQSEGVDIKSLNIRIKDIVADIGNIRNEVGVELPQD